MAGRRGASSATEATSGAQSVGESETFHRLSPIRAVERVCDIFDLLQESPSGLSLTDIAVKTGLPKSTVYRYLVALSSRGYIERDDDVTAVRLGQAFRTQPTRVMYQFFQLAEGVLQDLRNSTGETVNLGILDGRQYVHIIVVESPEIMRLAARIGERGMLHSTAIGKVIAAQLSEERVKLLVAAEGLPRFSERTITSMNSYMKELITVRRQGYALDDCENQEDGRCVAVPVPHVDVPMGISISAPARRFPMSSIGRYVSELRSAATRIAGPYLALS